MSSLSDTDWAKLDRFVSGEGDPGERVSTSAWIEAHDELRQLVEAMRAPSSRQWDTLTAWSATAHRAGVGAKREIVRTRRPHRGRWVIAAAVVLGVVATVYRGGFSPSHGSVAAKRFVTASAQRLSATLSDGTHLILGPASQLRVPADYASGDRTVQLEGEALFSVVSDPRHPFRVETREVMTTDLGTQFDVRAYPTDRAVQIAVAEGQVSVSNRTSHASLPDAALHAGDVAKIRGPETSVYHGMDVSGLTSWSRGVLVFRNTPALEVAQALSRWYDLRVIVDDRELDTLQLTATFGDESIAQALRVVTSLGLQAEQVGRVVHLRASSK